MHERAQARFDTLRTEHETTVSKLLSTFLELYGSKIIVEDTARKAGKRPGMVAFPSVPVEVAIPQTGWCGITLLSLGYSHLPRPMLEAAQQKAGEAIAEG